MAQAPNSTPVEDNEVNSKNICGVVMPISAIDGCSETHWSEVLAIVSEAIEKAGFEANLVSNADDVGVIQKRIIHNLYENPIVVCDVSAKNSNVMFELGMRLAFDKPTIIIKDDKTAYSFDTASIEHLEYPRDLRFSKIVDFKARLAEKVRATVEKSTTDPNYTTFLKHFGEFKVAKIEKREVSGQEYIIDELRLMRSQIARLERGSTQDELPQRKSKNSGTITSFQYQGEWSDSELNNILKHLSKLPIDVNHGVVNGKRVIMVSMPFGSPLERKVTSIIFDRESEEAESIG